MKNEHKPYGIYEKVFKRLLDVTCCFFALILIGWLMIILAVIVRIKHGTPVLFTQARPGLYGKIFKLYKFRSMTNEKDENGKLLPNEKRLTAFGRKMRSTSLDELPELFNIIKGDMSIVGPRPLLVEYLPRYNDEQKHRHDVRPGLTGYAQVNGRNAISWEEKFKLDVDYVNNITFKRDIAIVVKTFVNVIRREGINASNEAMMPEFMGTREGKNNE